MEKKEIAQYCIDNLLKSGARKAQAEVVEKEKNELQIEGETLSLFRSTTDYQVSLTAILEGKKGSVSINKIDKQSIKKAALQAVQTAESSQHDEANDIAEKQEAKVFRSGPDSADFETMYEKITELKDDIIRENPLIVVEKSILDFTRSKSFFLNSNGVDFASEKGQYNFSVMFTAKKGKKSSSFNFSGFSLKELKHKLYELGSVKTLLEQSEEQIEAQGFPGKITGDVIITPDCLGSFISYLTSYLYDGSLIGGTSIFKDKLDKPITDSRFTLHSKPTSDELAGNYFYTRDGYEARDSIIIDSGVLKTFLLSLYGAKKTGRKRAANMGGCYVAEPGDTSFDQMVKSVKKGVLLCRFSGGKPGENGDFSGVAKNSYYIEDGKIQYPLSETMVAGNIANMFNSIKAVSKERIHFGTSHFPWLQCENITISGKS